MYASTYQTPPPNTIVVDSSFVELHPHILTTVAPVSTVAANKDLISQRFFDEGTVYEIISITIDREGRLIANARPISARGRAKSKILEPYNVFDARLLVEEYRKISSEGGKKG
jgi:hypothetical protein